MVEAGTRDARQIVGGIENILRQIPAAQIEYVSIVDAETLENVDRVSGGILAAVAVRIGPARLIDNILVDSGA